MTAAHCVAPGRYVNKNEFRVTTGDQNTKTRDTGEQGWTWASSKVTAAKVITLHYFGDGDLST